MTTNSMNHEQFEALLPAWMEGELRGAEREAFTAHAESCAQCGPLVRDLEQIVAQAGALGPIEPPRELWTGIEARIGATVLPFASRRRTIPMVRGLAAAAVLVAATAGITWKLATSQADGDGTPTGAPLGKAPQVASTNTNTNNGPTEPGPTPGGGGPVIEKTPQFAAAPDRGTRRDYRPQLDAPQTVTTVKNPLKRMPGESDVYDREITRLRTVLRTRKSELDPRTVLAIEKSLAVIDTAIAQARSALAADPASRFLNDQLTNALDKKVELLRTAALLPARS